MYEFILNGKNVSVAEDINLLEYLRDYEDLTSVKNGCAEGACGACMILVDGKAVRACIFTTAKAHGKEVKTVEGLTEFEEKVFTWAFSKAGAVQCGFCIPGMIISAKSLLDKNLNPNKKEIKNAIRGNVCRCTGYVKIIKAIEMAAEAFRNGEISYDEEYKGKIGENIPRIDAKDKILGIGKYVDDIKIEGMIYGSALRSEYPRALVKSIDISEALKHPQVEAVLTAKDIPGNRFIGHIVKDWPAMIGIGEETRYVGDAVALVAAKSKKAVREILNLIKVEYEELEPLCNPKMAMVDGAPKIHSNGNVLTVEKVNRGNVDDAINSSKYVVTNHYSTPFTEHAFLEPESALAMPDGDGVTIYTGSQGIYDEQREISELLGLPKEKVRCISKYVGGGFGGKEDMSVQHHASLLAFIIKKPVKITLTRKESMKIHPKRHAMEMSITTACDENGNLTAFKADIIADTGAYASLGGPVLQRACTHAAGPYRCPNVQIKGTAVYTNNPPAGAFRGFGVTQSVFASESNLNLLAEKVGISPWEIRFKNAIEPGQALPNGQIADKGTAIKETILAVKDIYENSKYAGIACCMKNSGVGVGIPDIGRCDLEVLNGKVHIKTSAACIGQGLGTILTQIVCETTNILPSYVVLDPPDTFRTPNSGTTTASRQTVFTGEATKIAALKLKDRLLTKTLKECEGEEFYGQYEGITDPINSKKKNPVSHVAYGYATQVVILNKDGKVDKVIAAHDVGKAINVTNVEGQIEGGIVMGLGYAFTEDYPLNKSVPTAKFGTLGLFRATDIPEIEPIIIEKNTNDLAYGAKGIGEITTIPTAPASQGAYLKFDGEFRTKLPLENTAYRRKK
ncbi:selenium-dependent xanthine dehydrogenase [Clostridium sp. Marseille-Q2269]|uniref:selenium-dependent xanthine dehydrogenase n=1 Tax=Clostridium sp. Marseille-Q2269 TaxID=2942205 RepID=UPI002072C2BB|nr:selenium-dependent xanthine dehydrogenase [Clostridium sp. Marseille-Q2269]